MHIGRVMYVCTAAACAVLLLWAALSNAVEMVPVMNIGHNALSDYTGVNLE